MKSAAEVLPFEQFHCHEEPVAMSPVIKDRHNIWMVQPAQNDRFAFESGRRVEAVRLYPGRRA